RTRPAASGRTESLQNGPRNWPTPSRTFTRWTTASPCMRAGEIFLARFPFGDVPGMKLRPVLLLTGPIGSVPEVLVAYISSVVPTHPLARDLLIDPGKPEFRSTRLKN